MYLYLLLFCLLGIDSFKGVYFHSRDYKTPEQWRNKKVVVIGIGNSGGDIAVELSRVTKQVHHTRVLYSCLTSPYLKRISLKPLSVDLTRGIESCVGIPNF